MILAENRWTPGGLFIKGFFYGSKNWLNNIRKIMNKTKALIPESPLLILPSLAKEIGLNEAIVLQQMHYWLLNSTHSHNGEKWIYNSYTSWQKTNFPFWSIRTIQRIILNLEKTGIIKAENFNKLKMDRTKWYTIDYDKVPNIGSPSSKDDANNVPEWHEQDDNLCPPIPETTSKTSSEIKKERESKTRLSPEEINLLNIWNNCEHLRTHNLETINLYFKKKHSDIIKAITPTEVEAAILNYNEFCASPDLYYWTVKWTFPEFIVRGLQKFVNEAQPLTTFLKHKPKQEEPEETMKERLARIDRGDIRYDYKPGEETMKERLERIDRGDIRYD